MRAARGTMMMKMMGLVLLGLGAAGCSTQAENEAARMKGAMDTGKGAMEACGAKVKAMPSYLALKDKLPPYGSRDLAPMELLTNSSKPNPEEAALLLELHRDGIAPCRKLALEVDAKISPALIPPLTALYTKTDAQYARLVKREISWGEYAAANNEARTTHRAEAQQVAANIKAQLDRSHREELQRNADAWRAASEAIAASRPRTTQCTGGPLYVTCTTY